ncbi:MAG: TPM domain-containing protein, partial [Acidobacteriales bacterium]|nr:TPM domain-containing protein [Terriglobales bacterium]
MTLKTRTGIILFAVFSFAALLCAEPVSKLTPSNYVNDFAHVLSDSTAANLNALCKQVDEKAHAQIAVVTVKSLDGEDVESYAVDLFKKWGIGSKASDHGVLILLASDDRKYRVEVGYGLEPILPDGKVGDIGRQAVPLLRKGDYDAALSQMTWQVADVIAKDANVQLNTSSRPPPVPQEREQPQGG